MDMNLIKQAVFLESSGKIDGWEIEDKSYVSKGADPTEITKIIVSKGDKKIELGEFFGDWHLTDGSFKSKMNLKRVDIDKLLKDRDAPTLKQIKHKLDAEKNAYSGPKIHYENVVEEGIPTHMEIHVHHKDGKVEKFPKETSANANVRLHNLSAKHGKCSIKHDGGIVRVYPEQVKESTSRTPNDYGPKADKTVTMEELYEFLSTKKFSDWYEKEFIGKHMEGEGDAADIVTHLAHMMGK